MFSVSARSWRGRANTLSAAGLLLLAKALRATAPMHSWERLVGARNPATASTAGQSVPPSGQERAVARAISRATVHLPTRLTCLDQAVAGRWMFRMRGQTATVVIGLKRGDPEAAAHAWLVGPTGEVVTGSALVRDFVAVTEFR